MMRLRAILNVTAIAALVWACLVGAAAAQSVSQRTWQPPAANLTDIANLADPGAARVLKWNDTSNEIEWAVDATGGGGGGDVDGFAADPSSNGNFSAAAWITDLGLGALYQPLDADLTDLADGTLTGSKVSGAVVVSGGTINNSVIGGTTPAAGTFTTLRGNTGLRVWDTGADAGGYLNYSDSTGWSLLSGEAGATTLTVGSLTLSTDLTVANGGTGASTISGLVKGNGTSAFTAAVAGTDYVSPDAELTALAGLTSAADRLPYFTGSGTASLATFTSFGRSLADDADAAAGRTTLGLVIGTDVAAYNSGLNLLGLLSDPNADRIPFWDDSANAYAWLTVGSGLSITGTTITASGGGGGAPDAATYITQTADATLSNEQALGSLATGIVKNTTTTGVLSIAVAGTDYVAPDAELAALAGLTSAADALPYFTGSGTASTTTLTTTARSLLDDTSSTAMRATIGVAIGTAVQAYDSDLNSLSNGIVGIVKGLDDGNGFQAATLGTDYINNGSIDTSAELKSIVGDETGSGGALVFATSPTLTTPVINGFTGTSWDALKKKTRTFALFGATTDAATGDGAAYYPIPPELNGANITYVHLYAVTAGTTGTSDVQIARIRSGSPVDVLTTKVTIDSTEQGSDTAATAAVINTSNDDMATNDILRVDVDALSSTKPKGLIVTVGFELQ